MSAARSVRTPGFDGATGWLNSGPLTGQDTAGRVADAGGDRKQLEDFIGRTQRLFQRQRKHRSAGLLDLAFHHLHQLSPRSPPVVHARAWVLIVHRTDNIAG